jgi:hypothetical protein
VLDTSKSGAASLVYSTFYGGTGADEGYAITVANSIIYFAGTTNSTDLPLRNAVQATFGGGGGYGDVFAAKLDPALTGTNQLLFATYLGGSKDEIPGGVAADSSGSMYVAGVTGSTNFPITAISPTFGGGGRDAFLTKLKVTAPASLLYSRYVGGDGKDGIRDIAVDTQDNVYASGATSSSNLPTVSPIQSTLKGGTALSTDSWWFRDWGSVDAWTAKFDSTGVMTFGTYLGGTGADFVMGLRIGRDGKVYVAGGTRSTDLTLANAYKTTNAGTYDAFIISIGGLAPAGSNPVYLPLLEK